MCLDDESSLELARHHGPPCAGRQSTPPIGSASTRLFSRAAAAGRRCFRVQLQQLGAMGGVRGPRQRNTAVLRVRADPKRPHRRRVHPMDLQPALQRLPHLRRPRKLLELNVEAAPPGPPGWGPTLQAATRGLGRARAPIERASLLRPGPYCRAGARVLNPKTYPAEVLICQRTSPAGLTRSICPAADQLTNVSPLSRRMGSPRTNENSEGVAV